MTTQWKDVATEESSTGKKTPTESNSTLVTRRLRVHGIVQGVGFRPTVDRHAMATGVGGTVCNKGPYVEIVAQGSPTQVEEFTRLVTTRPPRRASIVRVETADVPADEVPRYEDFRIVTSERTRGAIFVSPDIAICDDCKRELFDPADRRYLHPFINCTCCGPRLTILESLPYDRERTSMKAFPMCPDCAREYHDPASRRYDAQPVCCNKCGPEVYLLDVAGLNSRHKSPPCGHDAITAARRAIAAGGIVAVKGVGGFHLCCDATNEGAVATLRARKRRPQKPFAVMMRDEEVVRRECEVTPAQMEVLTGHQKPIVLLRRRPLGRLAPSVAPGNPHVGVMLPYAPIQLLLFRYDDGVSMPDCLVMTSGNVSGAPICRSDDDVREQLAGLCDLALSNNRPILTRADDSVMDFFDGEPYMIRRSRGYAPLPVALSRDLGRQVLAVGGELKNTFCIGHDDLFYPSAYVGDLADLRTVRALDETVARMLTLLEVRPEAVACDLHPRYNSTAVAERLARSYGVPLVPVQHHYAHIVSCMAENDCEGPVLGVAFDGTGYGTDGTIWGGELMVCDWHGFRRVGSIWPFLQVGGDKSSLEGWRVATSMLLGAIGDEDPVDAAHAAGPSAGGSGASGGDAADGSRGCGEARHGAAPSVPGDRIQRYLDAVRMLGLCDARTARAQLMMVGRRLNAVTSTSVGRLFDAVSAVLGVRRASTFEGEASMALQFAAERFARMASSEDVATAAAWGRAHGGVSGWDACGALGQATATELAADQPDGFLVLRTDLLFRAIVDARLADLEGRPGSDGRAAVDENEMSRSGAGGAGRSGCDGGPNCGNLRADALAYAFHVGLAHMAAQACAQAAAAEGLRTVALSGGCFQNTLLLGLTRDELEHEGLRVLLHHLIPPNDGGIALGQAVVAAQAL